MAEVYLARQSGPGGYQKLVVTKRVRPHLSKDSDFVGMFVNEARLAAMINHPNVVQIFDLGEEPSDDPAGPGTDWFLAMEYLDGRDMLQVGRACRSHNKAVPFDVTARIIADACAGLEHAHNLKGADGKSLDLVHRDMSPENILITFEGQVKVVDFGIAKAADNSVRTQAGQIKGKLGYVAPEAILGKPVDARADIFAVGATLYLFLSGRPAFTGSSPMEIFERSLKPPPSPGEVNPRVPPALDEICMKALAQDRDKRYRTAGEVREALDDYLTSTGRPLGSPQLSQFMRILFPPDKDPVRQRIDKLLAQAPAFSPPPRAAPRTVTVARPAPTAQDRPSQAPRAVEIGPASQARVAEVSATGPSARALPQELPSATGPSPRAPARLGPSHLRSVGVSDDLVGIPSVPDGMAYEVDDEIDKTQLTDRGGPNTTENVDVVRTMDIEDLDSGVRGALDVSDQERRAIADALADDLDLDVIVDRDDKGTGSSSVDATVSARPVTFRPAENYTNPRLPETGAPMGTELPPPFDVSGPATRSDRPDASPPDAPAPPMIPAGDLTDPAMGGGVGGSGEVSAPLFAADGDPESTQGWDGTLVQEEQALAAPPAPASSVAEQPAPVSLALRSVMAMLGIATGSLILFIALSLAGYLPVLVGG